MSLRRTLGCWARALCVALVVILAASAAGGVEPPSGSKNFTAPGSVPDYFSNESGPFRGGATARAAPPGPTPGVVMPVPHRRVAVAARHHGRYRARHLGRAGGRLRLARGHAIGHRPVVHSGAARVGGKSAHRLALAPRGHAGGKAVAARAQHRPAPSKGRHVAGLHG